MPRAFLLLAPVLGTVLVLAACADPPPEQMQPPAADAAVLDARDAPDALDAPDGGTPPAPDAEPAIDADPAIVDQTPIVDAVADSTAEKEPSIGVASNGHVIVSFLSYPLVTVGYVISNDDGATWSTAHLLELPPDTNVQANASVAADAQGNVWLAWAAELHTARGRSHQHVYVAKAAPGATELEPRVEVTSATVAVGVYDLPRIAITANGTIHLTYLQTSPDDRTSWIMHASSNDGEHWTRNVAAGPGTRDSFRNFARLCQAPSGGRIYMVYVDSDAAIYISTLAVALRSSDDDGATWSDPLSVSLPEEETSLPAYGTDCVADENGVSILYALSPEAYIMNSSFVVPTLAELWIARSNDRGASIGERFEVADHRAAANFMYPMIVREDGGAIDLAYFAGDEDNDEMGSFLRTRAIDGKTFAPTAVVHAPIALETSRRALSWIGDYLGRAYSDGKLYLAYSDNANGANGGSHIGFYRSPVEMPNTVLGPEVKPYHGVPAEACYLDQVFEPVPWAPPGAFAQGACTPAQTTAYAACATAGDCSAFHAAMENRACVACLETRVDTSTHGPVIVGDTGEVLQFNFGGCEAHYAGDTDRGSCGNRVNDYNDCVFFECGACADWNAPSQYGPTFNCYYYSALEHEQCAGYFLTQACSIDSDAHAAECNDFSIMIASWCGP